MSINIRAKGASGEREVVDACEPIVKKVFEENGIPHSYAKPVMQRNQNQTAVGGSDITNPFGFSIEVKRQEALSINTWWAQCVKASETNNEHPVLLYRQNGKKWKCVTLVWLKLPDNSGMQIRAEFSWEDFLSWFEKWVRAKVQGTFNENQVYLAPVALDQKQRKFV